METLLLNLCALSIGLTVVSLGFWVFYLPYRIEQERRWASKALQTRRSK